MKEETTKEQAMEEMECWQTMEHIKKCAKCQQNFMEYYMKFLNMDKAEYVADCEDK